MMHEIYIKNHPKIGDYIHSLKKPLAQTKRIGQESNVKSSKNYDLKLRKNHREVEYEIKFLVLINTLAQRS